MTLVKSPYNFVPASTEDQVFKPDWAKDVSHDIPFEDGESGEIEIEITAETPIFIRDGHKKPKDGEKPTEEFSHFIDKNGQKKYFIPATSLKGMVRNVLEIMSFSRLNKNLINDHRYAFRDLSKSTNQYMTRYKKYEIQGGWLKENEDGSWLIEKCEELAHIDHRDLKDQLDIPFRDYFLNKQPKTKDSQSKYENSVVKNVGLVHSFKTVKKPLFGNVELNIAYFDSEGRKGQLVFTGQPGPRKEDQRDLPKEKKFKSSGKIREFVFFDSENPKILRVTKTQQKDFKFIYGHDDPGNLSKDWKYWREKLKHGEKAPVFFAENEKGELEHFGLSYMYKLPFKHRISELNLFNKDFVDKDLTETLFGYASKDEAQKGRLFFGHALAESDKVNVLPKVEAVLGGPKASYFPFYLEQHKDKGGYFTYDDLNARLRGFKRYPVQSKEVKTSSGDNQKVVSYFKPLDKGAKFKVKLRFHNLKSVEIGGVLSALTFHGYADTFFHSLGAAKPFGYGKVKIRVNDTRHLKKSCEDYMLDFENLMISKYPNWLSSPQIKELFAMAKGEVNEEFLSYPVIKDFISIKQENESLEPFTEFFENVDPSKLLKPFSVRLKPQNKLELESFDNYQDLSKYLNEEISIFGEFTEVNKSQIFDKIVQIIEAKHKDSIKKLRKDSHWDGNISSWLGNDLKDDLKEKLNPLL
ncbi:TIGR03986 family CRISPR-associated RAMP protein [Belliella sp. DSM 111904]|uniref:TIGR03986 family CRISPR-associated RAMP protein n=1 Tax=Belliella filtrata TaxID=2923435 RepID=A0ABS9V4W2_9BACT|nr:TIGR03986 family CRISPR-associated RAMP protein [Belliella filtrata]MCH7411424.1 TIGR03986 family CRISPR-associated RAMP protein [Belliella filtrata]